MTNVQKTLKERLIPVKVLVEKVDHNWDDLQITETLFEYDSVQLTIANIHNGEEAYITLTVPEYEDKGDDLLPKLKIGENPGYTYARAYAKSAHRFKLNERIKDALLWMVNPMYEEIEIWEEQAASFETVAA